MEKLLVLHDDALDDPAVAAHGEFYVAAFTFDVKSLFYENVIDGWKKC